MIKKIKDFLKDGEAIRYVVIGVLTTLVNFLVYTLLCKGFSVDVTVSNVTSVIISILFAYVTNKIFVFKSRCASFGQLCGEFVKFVGARLLTMVIEVGGVFLLVNVLKGDELLGKLATQVIVIVGNYFISKFLVFTSKRGEETK